VCQNSLSRFPHSSDCRSIPLPRLYVPQPRSPFPVSPMSLFFSGPAAASSPLDPPSSEPRVTGVQYLRRARVLVHHPHSRYNRHPIRPRAGRQKTLLTPNARALLEFVTSHVCHFFSSSSAFLIHHCLSNCWWYYEVSGTPARCLTSASVRMRARAQVASRSQSDSILSTHTTSALPAFTSIHISHTTVGLRVYGLCEASHVFLFLDDNDDMRLTRLHLCSSRSRPRFESRRAFGCVGMGMGADSGAQALSSGALVWVRHRESEGWGASVWV